MALNFSVYLRMALNFFSIPKNGSDVHRLYNRKWVLTICFKIYFLIDHDFKTQLEFSDILDKYGIY